MRLPDDPEPARRPRGRIVAGVVGAVAVAAGVTAVAVGTTGDRSPGAVASTAPHVPAPGRLLVWDPDRQRIDAQSPDGTASRPAGARQIVAVPVASPDRRFVVSMQGTDLLSVSGMHLSARTPQLGPPNNGSGFLPSQPFADHDRDLIAPRSPSSDAPILLVDQRTGHYLRLGSGDDVAGDPTARAVYVAVAHGRPVPDQPDDRIERRTGHGAATLVVTAAQVRRAAQLPAGELLSLESFPAPDTAFVAVLATAVHGGLDTVVVVTPTGRVVEVARATRLGIAGWSPDGRKLALVAGRSLRLLVWSRPDRRLTTVALPGSSPELFSCVWHPADTWLACAGATPGQPVSDRVLVNVQSRRTWTVRAGGMPVVWLPEAAA